MTERRDLPTIPSLREAVSEAEWQTRVDLAASYRLVAREGWDDLLSTHISARVPEEPHHFLINPYGLLFSQITASSLIKVDYQGNRLSESPFPHNPAAITIHAAVLEARSDVASVLHMHSIAGTAVSTLREGLLPINQRALYFQDVLAYHDYEGLALDDAERESLVRDLGECWVMILRNHGTLACGRSVAQAYVNAFFLEKACQMQVQTLSCGAPLQPLPPDVIRKVPEQAKHMAHWGRFEWPALCAALDREDPSYRD
ncbi:MAG: class II aldolase/adducin family protein [Myxococcota bacterium]